MKTLRTIFLSLVAIVASLVLVLSTLAVIMYAAVSWLESVLRKGVKQ